MKKVLVAGCGDLGRGVAEYFVQQGAEVIGIRRTGIEFPAGVFGITGDLTQLAADAWPDADLLYLIMTPQERGEAAYHNAYVATAQAVVNAYQGRPSPQVIFVSSTSVYGQNQGQWVDDDSVAIPASATACKLIEAEQTLSQGLKSTAVRCSGIYGPGRFGLLRNLQKGEPWSANQWTNRIHRDDVVSALCFLGEKALEGDSLPETIIATDAQPTTMWEVKLWLSVRLNITPPLPDNIAFADYFPLKGKRIIAQQLKQLGWLPQYPSYALGYEGILQHFS